VVREQEEETMTREEAEELVFGDVTIAVPAAAIELLVATTEGPTAWREYARRAFHALNMAEPLLPEREPLDEAGDHIGRALVEGYREADPADRPYVWRRYFGPGLKLFNDGLQYLAARRERRATA
jgi:hypothetical protein